MSVQCEPFYPKNGVAKLPPENFYKLYKKGKLEMDWLKREEENLQEQLANGEIDIKEYNEQMRELRRDYRTAAEEASQRAYDDEMERW